MDSTSALTPPSQPPGAWLTHQMKRRGIGVRQLADALGVTSKTVYDWRDGRTTISEERVLRLAEVLGIAEIEARRGLGLWVPDETAKPETVIGRGELEQLKADLLSILDRIDKLQQG